MTVDQRVAAPIGARAMRFLWKLSEKVSETVSGYLAPVLATNSIDEFKSACTAVLDHIRDSAPDATVALIGALNNMQDYLIEELNEGQIDQPCVAFLVGDQIMDRIVRLIDSNLPRLHVEPVVNFFLAFVKAELNPLFLQISVHRPFTQFLTLLPVLCLRDPETTRQFASDLWNTVKTSPLMLEMMSSEKELPLIDFFCLTALTPGADGELSRSAVYSISVQKELSKFRDYLTLRFFPELAGFLLNAAADGSTFQFSGSLSGLIDWIDRLLLTADDFPFDLILKGVGELGNGQQVLAVSFLLACFTADAILGPARRMATSREFLSTVARCLKSSDETDQKSALAFLRVVFDSDLPMADLMPSRAENQTDVLSCLPAPWLVGLEGSTGMRAYDADALTRLQYFGSGRIDGTNPELFGAVLDLFKRFKTIPLVECLSVTKVITSFVSSAPDLISDELTGAFAEAVASLADVSVIDITNERPVDSPELRAALLVEFGKEIHATFVTSEKLNALAGLIRA
jgi:hypothetical protein